MKTLIMFFAKEKAHNKWEGKYIYELDENPSKFGAPHGFSGLASAIHAEYVTSGALPSVDYLGQFDVILFVGKLFFDIELIRSVKLKFPHILIIGQFEENVRKHKAWCRDRTFYKTFHEFSRLVDVMTTFHEKTTQYYELFCKTKVHYLSHAYPLQFVRKITGSALSYEERDKLFLKGGFLFGRPGQDGFAETVALIRAQRSHPEFKIQVIDYPRKTEEAIAIYNVFRRIEKNRLYRLPRIIRNMLVRVPEIPQPEDVFNLNSVEKEKYRSQAYCRWDKMLPSWRFAFLGLDMDQGFTTGRNVLDAAAFGTPVIGVNSDFQQQIYPELMVKELDYEKAQELIEQLVQKKEFYNEISRKGLERVNKFSYENARIYFEKFVSHIISIKATKNGT